ncbi:MAG: hypothetical protein KGO96_07440 [Elusimicrobia bacterium]|nr:hypothetical protein [Elusimicrobiota bacterium]
MLLEIHGKTVSASIIESLGILHLNRDVVHLAAIKQQSLKSQSYIANYFNRPILRDYVTKKKETRVEITKYIDEMGNILSPIAWNNLDDIEKEKYIAKTNYIQVILATLQSTNGEHGQFLVLDELDIIRAPQVIEEAKLVPTVGMNGELPITFLTSSRKFSYGYVQKEIDDAAKTGTHIRHWNIIDVTKPCPPERHRPDLPKLPIYVSNDTLEAVSEEQIMQMSPDLQQKFVKTEGYNGCLNNCKRI